MLRNNYGRYMQSSELMPVLGFKRGGHLPHDGFAPTKVNGTWFQCLPKAQVKTNKSHRLLCFCRCGRWVPFGRYGQHIKACNDKRYDPDVQFD